MSIQVDQTSLIQNTPFRDWGAYASDDADMIHFADRDNLAFCTILSIRNHAV